MLRRNIKNMRLQIPRRRRHMVRTSERLHRLGWIPRSRADISSLSAIGRHRHIRTRRNIRLGGFEVQVPAKVERDAAHHGYLDTLVMNMMS